jgi:hypothetical protein
MTTSKLTAPALTGGIDANWQPPQWPGIVGSVGGGAADFDFTRTAGFGTYGLSLLRLLVTARVVPGEFDAGSTTWVGATNLGGGQLFAGWDGANSPARHLGQTYDGGAVIGREINAGNRWGDFGLLADVGAKRYTVGLQLVPDVLPARDGVNATPVAAISVGAPGAVEQHAHGYTPGMGVVFGGDGTLPAPLVKGVPYYVSAAGLTADSYRFSATPGGRDIDTSGAFVGPVTVVPSYPGSFAAVIGASVHGHRWHTGLLLRPDTIMPGGYGIRAHGGSAPAHRPDAFLLLSGAWGRGLAFGGVFGGAGIDFEGGTFGTAPINIPYTGSVVHRSSTAEPSKFDGYACAFSISGTRVYVPYILVPE